AEMFTVVGDNLIIVLSQAGFGSSDDLPRCKSRIRMRLYPDRSALRELGQRHFLHVPGQPGTREPGVVHDLLVPDIDAMVRISNALRNQVCCNVRSLSCAQTPGALAKRGLRRIFPLEPMPCFHTSPTWNTDVRKWPNCECKLLAPADAAQSYLRRSDKGKPKGRLNFRIARETSFSSMLARPGHSPPDLHYLRTRGVAGCPSPLVGAIFRERQVLIEISFLTLVTPGADQALAWA